MKKSKILKLINEKLDDEIIKKLLLPNIGFKLNQGRNNIINSKIGGVPILIDGKWPFLGDVPLTFLGQIYLSEISGMNNVLPKHGILYFFILTNDIGYRYPDKKGEYKIIYVNNPSDSYSSNDFPSNITTNYINEHYLNFYESYSFPSYQENIMDKNKITDNELNLIDDIEDEIMYLTGNDYDVEHQILGHPKALQGTVRFWWALKYLGIDFKSQFSDEELIKIKNEEDNFMLLLQLNFGDPKLEFDYFGESVLYFGIHKNDLLNENFENVVLVMQNT